MSNAKLLRRATGSLCLVGAVVMLAVGETHLAPGNSHLGFLLYWLGCFALAIAAMIVAILDLFAVRSEARQAQRSLFEETLVKIETDRKRRPKSPPPGTDLKD